jgi:hypothetical protein
MKLRRTFSLLAVAVSLSACGGSSGSSSAVVTEPSGSNEVNAGTTNSTMASNSAPQVEPSLPPLETDPAKLLIDSSLDIGAIDGPVVLWFWAPG